MGIGIASIRDYFAPVAAGQVAGVIAQTSQYKSGFLHFVENVGAMQLVAQERTNEAIVHVSVEECVEEQAFLEYSRQTDESAGNLSRGIYQDWDKLVGASYKIAGIPIYRIGDSLARAEDFPNLYLSNIFKSIRYMSETMKIIPAMIAVDYLQALPIDLDNQKASFRYDEQRRLQVRQDIFRLRHMAAWFKCPVWVGIQAKQKLDGAPNKDFQLPGIYDGEETASIAQRFDRLISLWMPKMTHHLGDVLEYNGTRFTVAENLLWFKVLKQRGSLKSGKSWKCWIDFQKNLIAPMGDTLTDSSEVSL
jgi:hypothetical protein